MRPLERSPGNDPGLPGCACPGVSLALCAFLMGWPAPVRPSAPGVGIQGIAGRADLNHPSGAKRDKSPAPAGEGPKARHILAPETAPPGRTTDPEAMNFVPRRFERGLGRR